jgi:small conductance mechanosensitive channel
VRRVEGIILKPAPDLVVTELAASSINMSVRVWIDDPSLEQPVYFRVIEASKLALDAAGIQIPYPHLQLFLEDVDARVWQQAVRFAETSASPGPSGTAGAS